MVPLKPARVFVHKRVYENAAATARLERMLAAMGNPPVEDVDVSDTKRVIDALEIPPSVSQSRERVLMGLHRRDEDPVLLFNTFVWDESGRSDVVDELPSYSCAGRVADLMAGVGEDFAFCERHPGLTGRVCQGGCGIHSLKGCVYRCDYCEEGYIVNVMLDLEDFAEHVRALTVRKPEQKLYRYDSYSDCLCFEPEYGASALLSEMFSRTEDQWLLYYSRSDNVDHLLDLPHKDRAIYYCTMSTESVCRDIERGAPSMTARIAALRKCQQAGYRVRVGFSPILPIPGWREEASACLERLFDTVQPETIRLWVLSLTEAAGLEELLSPNRLDPVFHEWMHRAAAEMNGQFAAPFPLEARAELYAHYLDEIRRISPHTPVSLCSEDSRLWEMLAPKLAMQPDQLYCCCGGTSVPGSV